MPGVEPVRKRLDADDRRWLINALERWNRDDVIPGGFKLGDIVQHSSGFVAVVSSEHVTSNPDRYVPVKVLADHGNSYKAGDLNGYEPHVLTKIGEAACRR